MEVINAGTAVLEENDLVSGGRYIVIPGSSSDEISDTDTEIFKRIRFVNNDSKNCIELNNYSFSYSFESGCFLLENNSFFSSPPCNLSKERIHITFPEGTRIPEPDKITTSLTIHSDSILIKFNQTTSELVCMPSEQNQINITDCTTGELKETLLSDEIISQVFPFQTDSKQGFWVIPLLTTIGAIDSIYLFTWVENKISLQTYSIGNYFFEKNVFNDESGNLYLITTDLTSETAIYNLLVLNPENSISYNKYTIENTNNWLNKMQVQ